MLYFDNNAILLLKNHINEYVNKNRAIFILCDNHTETDCLPVLQNYISATFIDEVISIPSGEKNKSIEMAVYLWQRLLDKNADKNTVLICLGGGMICDLGGFVAATFKRGIDYVYIPTSLMAQIDAAVGGKTAINLNNVKNSIGLFTQPNSIYTIPYFLQTLPEKEILSGFAEMLKHGLIADKIYWEKLIQIKDISQITDTELIKKSIDIKTAISNTDPYDVGERRKLNFGHTIGHALEAFALSLTYPISHGEAVAWGMITELHISCQKKLINEKECLSIVNVLQHFFPSFSIQEDYAVILSYLQNDKKNANDKLNFTLLNSIGHAVINQQVNQNEIINALEKL
ncbi:MAG: 3-dehydroquinate synthase [Bacteroidales bacterium]|jgi:3-dehydroquinate synthase|nr:3-dehydroquinate synthase [Bacteroidales bacterium]